MILMNEALTFFFIISVIYNDAVMQVFYFHKAYWRLLFETSH